MTPEEDLMWQDAAAHWSPRDDARWDAEQCTCGNNEDYCNYCLKFYEEAFDNGPETD